MHLSRLRRATIAAVLVIVGTLTLGPATSAHADQTASAKNARRLVDMNRVGVNHDVAKANGFEVRTDSKGVEYSVSAGTPVGINGTVAGPCGWSWFDWVDIDYWGRRASIYSGFEVRPGWQPDQLTTSKRASRSPAEAAIGSCG